MHSLFIYSKITGVGSTASWRVKRLRIILILVLVLVLVFSQRRMEVVWLKPMQESSYQGVLLRSDLRNSKTLLVIIDLCVHAAYPTEGETNVRRCVLQLLQMRVRAIGIVITMRGSGSD